MVKDLGYAVAETHESTSAPPEGRNLARPVLILFGLLFAAVLISIIFGEWLGLFEPLKNLLLWHLWLASILATDFPVFKKEVQGAMRGIIIDHTLMTVGVLANSSRLLRK